MFHLPRSTFSYYESFDFLSHIVGCTLDDVLAIGDGDNDAAMLSGCGLGCAVANATPAAKEAASHVVASCDDAGFAEAVFMVLN